MVQLVTFKLTNKLELCKTNRSRVRDSNNKNNKNCD